MSIIKLTSGSTDQSIYGQPGGPGVNGQWQSLQPGYVYQSQTNLHGGQLNALPPDATLVAIKKYFAESQANKALIPNLAALLVKHLSPQQRTALAIQLFNSAVPDASENKPEPQGVSGSTLASMQARAYIETFDEQAQAVLLDQIVQKHLAEQEQVWAAEARAGAFEDDMAAQAYYKKTFGK